MANLTPEILADHITQLRQQAEALDAISNNIQVLGEVATAKGISAYLTSLALTDRDLVPGLDISVGQAKALITALQTFPTFYSSGANPLRAVCRGVRRGVSLR